MVQAIGLKRKLYHEKQTNRAIIRDSLRHTLMPNYGGLHVAGAIQSIGGTMPKTNYRLKPGGRICRCPTCGEAFSGIKAFDLHRVGAHAENRSCIRLEGSDRHIITTPKGKHKTLVLETLPRGTFWGILNE